MSIFRLFRTNMKSTLKLKIIGIFTILTIIPLSIVGIVSYSKSFSTIEKNISHSTEQIAEQLNTSIDLIFKDSIKLLRIGSYDNTSDFLISKDQFERYESAKMIGELFKQFRSIQEFDKQIRGISIIGLNGTSISEREGVYTLRKDVKEINTINTILEQPWNIHIIPTQKVEHTFREMYSGVISVGTAIFKLSTNEVCGAIIVDVDRAAIEEILNNITIGSTGRFWIVDNNGEIIFAPKDYPTDSMLDGNTINQIIESKKIKGNFIDKTKKEEELIIYNTLNRNGWKIIGKVRLDEIISSVYDIRNITISVIVVSIIFVFILNVFITEKLTYPIRNLKKKMKVAEMGNFEVRAECKNTDEIAELCHSFNKMIKKIKELHENSIVEHENSRKSEFKAMQAQINPHFLYNTLDSIVWAVEVNKKDQVVEMTKALSIFFKTVLSEGKEWITLRDETEHVRSYLRILKMRYRDILEYEINLSEDILNYKILKLTLQPIVENAIYHGIKNKRTLGMITITGKVTDDNMLLLEVTDNGQGMTEEMLQEVIENMNNFSEDDTRTSGFGLKNINQRIKLYYGEQYGLLMESEYKKGTKVSIIVPGEG